MFNRNPNPVKFAKTELKPYESKVQNNLAFTVKDMAAAVAQGKPISTTSMTNMFYDGSTDVTFDLPLDQHRGVDLNDMFQASETSKKKLSKFNFKKVES